MSPSEARDLAASLAARAVDGDPVAWAAGAAELERLSARSWLLLDQAARTSIYAGGAPVHGLRGWWGPSIDESSGFVAVVTSLHVDGRFRERAAQALGRFSSVLTAAALGARLLDHVPQVRAAAWAALASRLRLADAEPVLDVLLAGRGRGPASEALDRVQAALLELVSPGELCAVLTASDRRQVRRWAFRFAHERGLLDPDRMVTAAVADPDQWLRSTSAEWLSGADRPDLLVGLLDARSVEARMVALTWLPDDRLSDDRIRAALLDRASRMRDQARWRARRRGLDVLGHCRDQLAGAGVGVRAGVAALDGIALLGDRTDLAAGTTYLRHPSHRIRAAAIATVAQHARPDEAAGLLVPLLSDGSGRVSRAAARALVRLGAPAHLAEEAWGSAYPASRRAAWRLARGGGGWHRVEADLRAAGDPDEHLAGLGTSGLVGWLDVHAASTWDPLPTAQRSRIAALLERAPVGDHRRALVAFHAGIARAPGTPRR